MRSTYAIASKQTFITLHNPVGTENSYENRRKGQKVNSVELSQLEKLSEFPLLASLNLLLQQFYAPRLLQASSHTGMAEHSNINPPFG